MRRALAAALALVACSPTEEPASATATTTAGAAQPAAAAPSADGWLLPGTDWRLVELDGAPFPARTVARLTEDGRVTGQAPCNRFTATWTGRWPDLAFTPVASTRMACPDLAAESAFFEALGRVIRADLGPDGLTLTGPGATRLRFVRL